MSLTPTPELLANIFRIETFDPLTQKIATRLKAILADDSLENVEIEAKFGIFVDRRTNDRFIVDEAEDGFVALRPVPNAPYRFVTDVPEDKWMFLKNTVLNGRLENFNNLHYPPQITTRYTETIDEFYGAADGGNRIRVSKDLRTGEVLECIRKEEVGISGANVNILNNRRSLDFRISAKREVVAQLSDIPGYDRGSAMMVAAPRTKLRHTFQTNLWTIDLTELPPNNQQQQQQQQQQQGRHQQQQQSQMMDTSSTYEIEIELNQTFTALLQQTYKESQLRHNRNFDKIVRSLVDTMRMLFNIMEQKIPLPPLCTQQPMPGMMGIRKTVVPIAQNGGVVPVGPLVQLPPPRGELTE